MLRITALLAFIYISFTSFASSPSLVDASATAETSALFRNLLKIQNSKQTIFGQQDATIYGRTWMGDKNRSDVKDLSGDHPALTGLDLEHATEQDISKFQQSKQQLVHATKETYQRGGIITYSWHTRNPANDGSFYWEKNPIESVADILPGGKLHDKYKAYLRSIANVISECKGDKGELIPIIFRPFHEFDGDWFWWGIGHCSKEDFITLWRFTVSYLRDDLQVHNLLYAFSPDCKFSTKVELLNYYPGDEYVDIIGMDNYWDFRPDGSDNPQLAEQKLQLVASVAKERNKVAALTETGLEGIVNPTWYTQVLLPILEKVNIAYVMVWRNAYDIENHYYTPTIGHPAANDFIDFSENKNILLLKKLPKMYK